MITLGGKTDKELNLHVARESLRPILPDTRDRSLTIPLRHGAYDFGADLSPLYFDLECTLLTQSPKDLQTVVRNLAAHLLEPNGKPKTLELRFDYEPEKYYMVRYAGSLPIERVAYWGTFTLPLVAYEPYAFAKLEAYDEQYDYDTGLEYDSGLMYPNMRTVHDWSFLSPNQMLYMGEREWAGFVWTYERHMSSQTNFSNFQTPLVIEIAGDVTNPKITNDTNGQSMTINATLSNQVLRIDGEKMTVTIDGVNALKYFSGDFIQLEPEGNGFFFEGINPYAHVTFMWKHRFL